MTPEDAAKVLLLVQVFDNRQFDETTARVWADALSGLELDDCLDAVRIYFKHSREWLMPSDLRDQARSVIRGRRERERKESERLAIGAGLPDEDRVIEHVEAVRQAVAEASKLPPEKSPHPPMETPMLRAAKKVKCPWCGAARRSPCRNRWTERTLNFAHELRLMEAGLIAKDEKAYAHAAR
jgi:hypothetical protein